MGKVNKGWDADNSDGKKIMTIFFFSVKDDILKTLVSKCNELRWANQAKNCVKQSRYCGNVEMSIPTTP